MKSPEQVMLYMCIGRDTNLAVVQHSITDVAETLGFELQNWIEDGWGAGYGFNARLSNGVVVHLEEYVLQPEPGITGIFDEVELKRVTPRALLDLACKELGIPSAAVTWRNPGLAWGHAQQGVQADAR